MQSLEDLRKIVRFCQKNGILKYKDGDFEIELKEKIILKEDHEPKEIVDAMAQFPSWDSLTPEQKLLWSATPDNVGT